jgi:hypothetical protein
VTIQHDEVVFLHYHLTNAEGEVIESSRGSDPLTGGVLYLEHPFPNFLRCCDLLGAFWSGERRG